MRLWSLHPSLLDRAGLVALWREGLLAQAVLRGETVGYRNHPQLVRFRSVTDPVAEIAAYLHLVADEADRRGYSFNRSKLPVRGWVATGPTVTRGQLAYEFAHLQRKLANRAVPHPPDTEPVAHPIFRVVDGPVAEWEVV